jgi:uncharacterized protein YndB with AHSA1/START domain
MKTIKRSIEINAPKHKVWEVLTTDQYTRKWYSVFSDGSHAETNWEEGGKALFTDNSGGGMIAKVIRNKPAELLALEFEGLVKQGKEDYDSEEAKKYKGGHESYKLSEKNGRTQLDIESDMDEQLFESMSVSWEQALQKIKELAE